MTREELLKENAGLVPSRVLMRRRKGKRKSRVGGPFCPKEVVIHDPPVAYSCIPR